MQVAGATNVPVAPQGVAADADGAKVSVVAPNDIARTSALTSERCRKIETLILIDLYLSFKTDVDFKGRIRLGVRRPRSRNF